MDRRIIDNTIFFVKQELRDAEGGHDWYHVERVWKLSKMIGEEEGADMMVVELAALLHDIADHKFHDGDEKIGPARAAAFLKDQKLDNATLAHIVNIIKNISFKGGNTVSEFSSPELNVVQDADRLDAIGAIGIARTFNYGGYKNRKIYDPDSRPNMNMDKEAYKNSTAPTIDHFYEKLLLLKDRMNTAAGKRLAGERHIFMQQFLEQFYKEWHIGE